MFRASFLTHLTLHVVPGMELGVSNINTIKVVLRCRSETAIDLEAQQKRRREGRRGEGMEGEGRGGEGRETK